MAKSHWKFELFLFLAAVAGLFGEEWNQNGMSSAWDEVVNYLVWTMAGTVGICVILLLLIWPSRIWAREKERADKALGEAKGNEMDSVAIQEQMKVFSKRITEEVQKYPTKGSKGSAQSWAFGEESDTPNGGGAKELLDEIELFLEKHFQPFAISQIKAHKSLTILKEFRWGNEIDSIYWNLGDLQASLINSFKHWDERWLKQHAGN